MSVVEQDAEPQSFDELAQMRRDLVVVNQRNGTFEGLMRFVSELYPDTAHFVYELLQNAQDAGATSARFDVQDGLVDFSHNGTKPFGLRDVMAITNIGSSTKRDDATQIGKFGVGFKAVFSYCSSPVIYSPGYSFRIDDLFVPVEVSNPYDDGLTHFILNLDNPKKGVERARAEVLEGLGNMADSSLLFLSSLSEIHYRVGASDQVSLLKAPVDDSVVRVVRRVGADESHSEWLVFHDESGVASDDFSHVAVAFALTSAQPASRNGKSDDARFATAAERPRRVLMPLAESPVHVYFPAVKEPSGMPFLIHGPFLTTAARDSLTSSEHNDALVARIAELAASSLHELKRLGLLNTEALACMPNNEDRVPGQFQVVRQRILDAFNHEPLTPVFRGGHGRAFDLYQSPAAFRRAFDRQDLSYLTQGLGHSAGGAANWVASPDGRPGALLASLALRTFGYAELTDALGELTWGETDPDAELDKAWKLWIEGRTDSQMRSLYKLLAEGFREGEVYGVDAPIVRCHGKHGIRHLAPKYAKLHSDSGRRDPGFVLAAVAPDAEEDPVARTLLEQFYGDSGVERLNQSHDLVDRIVRWPETGLSPNELAANEDYFADINEMLDELEQGGLSPVQLRRISSARIVLSGDPDCDTPSSLSRPDESVLGAEFTGLALEKAYPTRARVWGGYKRRLGDKVQQLEVLGARCALHIVHASVWENSQFDYAWGDDGRWSEYGEDRDWILEPLGEIADSQDVDLLVALWDLLARTPSTRSKAVFRTNASRPRRVFGSQLAQELVGTAWVLMGDGSVVKPEAAEYLKLHPRLEEPGQDSILWTLGFGRALELERVADAKLTQAVEDLGFSSVEEARRGAQLLRDPRMRQLADQISAEERGEAFDDAPADPARRLAVARQRASEASERGYEVRERTVRVGGGATRAEARAYLLGRYGSEEMACQMCAATPPFHVGGKPYFEAVTLLPELRLEIDALYTALCPVCSARVKHAMETSEEAISNQLSDWDFGSNARSYELSIRAGAEDFDVVFDTRHAIDFRAAVEESLARNGEAEQN